VVLSGIVGVCANMMLCEVRKKLTRSGPRADGAKATRGRFPEAFGTLRLYEHGNHLRMGQAYASFELDHFRLDFWRPQFIGEFQAERDKYLLACCDQACASKIMLKGVSVARRKRLKPASVTTWRNLPSPAWAPSPNATS